jgi:hypothetical protein
VCPYQARAHPLVSAHEGFGSLTIEKNIVLAAAAVDRLLARPQCDEIVELIKLGRMRTGGRQNYRADNAACSMSEPFAGLTRLMVNVVCDVIPSSSSVTRFRSSKHADRVIVMAVRQRAGSGFQRSA